MESTQREFFIHRIVSGSIHIDIDGKDYYLRNLNKYDRYKAQLVYNKAVKEAELSGLWNEDEVLEMMLVNGFWSSIQEQLMIDHQNNIEEFKVALYEAEFQSNTRFAIRTKLNSAKKELDKLSSQRHAFDYLTTKSIGLMTKLHFTICNGLYDSLGQKVYKGDEWDNGIIDHIDYCIDTINSGRLTETEYRELARNEPWRLTWNTSKNSTLFDIPASEYTEEQKMLVFWSRLYDQINEHSEAPSDEVLEDDDMLDGWLIRQKKLREKSKAKQAGENLIKNSRIRDSDEIYLMAQTQADADKIHAMNDAAGEIARKTTMALINKHGSVKHSQLPHVQQLIMMRAAQAGNYAKGK
jgi:hypothetical protein